MSFPFVVHALEQLQQDAMETKKPDSIRIYYRACRSGTHLTIENTRKDDTRTGRSVWDSLFDMAVSIADQFEILPIIPRRTGRQINRADHPADNPSQYWQRSMYYRFWTIT